MSKTKRPPEVLRKAHPHLDSDERAKSKRELLDALEEAVYGDAEEELDFEQGGADDAHWPESDDDSDDRARG